MKPAKSRTYLRDVLRLIEIKNRPKMHVVHGWPQLSVPCTSENVIIDLTPTRESMMATIKWDSRWQEADVRRAENCRNHSSMVHIFIVVAGKSVNGTPKGQENDTQEISRCVSWTNERVRQRVMREWRGNMTRSSQSNATSHAKKESQSPWLENGVSFHHKQRGATSNTSCE